MRRDYLRERLLQVPDFLDSNSAQGSPVGSPSSEHPYQRLHNRPQFCRPASTFSEEDIESLQRHLAMFPLGVTIESSVDSTCAHGEVPPLESAVLRCRPGFPLSTSCLPPMRHRCDSSTRIPDSKKHSSNNATGSADCPPTAALPKLPPPSWEDSGVVLNVGGPVWALDFLPVPPSSESCAPGCILAVATHPADQVAFSSHQPVSGQGLLQLWWVPRWLDGKPSPTAVLTEEDGSLPPAQLDVRANQDVIKPTQNGSSHLEKGQQTTQRQDPLFQEQQHAASHGEKSIATLRPELSLVLRHSGVYCRSLQWLPHSSSSCPPTEPPQPSDFYDRLSFTSGCSTSSFISRPSRPDPPSGLSTAGDGSVGFLLGCLGDKSAVLWRIPKSPFPPKKELSPEPTGSRVPLIDKCVDLAPVWKSPENFDVLCAAAATPSELPMVDDSLRIACGTRNGEVVICHLGMTANNGDGIGADPLCCGRDTCGAPLIVSSSAIEAVAWIPTPGPSLIAAGSSDGCVSVWDVRQPLGGQLFRYELTQRPVTSISWPALWRHLLVGHAHGVCVHMANGESTTHTPGKLPTPQPGRLILDKQSWSTATSGHLAFFTYDDGCLLFGSLVDWIKKRFGASTLLLVWRINNTGPSASCPCPLPASASPFAPEAPEGLRAAAAAEIAIVEAPSTASASEQQEENSDESARLVAQAARLRKLQHTAEVEQLRSHGLRISLGDATDFRQDSDKMLPRILALNRVCAMEPLGRLDPFDCLPLVAYGGTAGIVHIFAMGGGPEVML
eukprot:GHVT01043765.1.p1 GENE.GHVT01043765.1~~GHVT01043765.1.p1  ORF type:complete len:783 (-),score=76.84 GHVT01043765.1:4146-6494(-)